MWLDVVVALAVGAPALGAALVGAMALGAERPRERAVVRVATTTLTLSLVCVLVGWCRWLAAGLEPVDVALGHWFRAGDYGFELAFLVDGASAPFALLASVLLLATCRFSAKYLHREAGFARFFVLTLVFGAGVQLLALAGSLDLLFAGWELVGVTSVLLVAFFHERRGPVRAAVRVLVTYRLCDVGLLFASVLIHQTHHTTVFEALRSAASAHPAQVAAPATAVGLALLLASMGKSAQLPVGDWLPRAMEGPTASSAVFYGGLSVHAGVFLLVRTAPLYRDSAVACGAIILIGAVTAVIATLSGQVSPDAKSSLAYATIAQVSLMFVECGLGLTRLAIVHLSAHAILRYYQFLRTPSVLQDALARRSALGATIADESAARWEVLGVGVRRFLYRLAIERFEVEASMTRWIAGPLLALGARLDRWESAAMGGTRPKGDAPPPGEPPSGWSGPAITDAPRCAAEPGHEGAFAPTPAQPAAVGGAAR